MILFRFSILYSLHNRELNANASKIICAAVVHYIHSLSQYYCIPLVFSCVHIVQVVVMHYLFAYLDEVLDALNSER